MQVADALSEPEKLGDLEREALTEFVCSGNDDNSAARVEHGENDIVTEKLAEADDDSVLETDSLTEVVRKSERERVKDCE